MTSGNERGRFFLSANPLVLPCGCRDWDEWDGYRWIRIHWSCWKHEGDW